MRQVGSRARGQTGTEYMLVVSVIVIAVVGAAYVFVPSFEEGVDELGRDVRQVLATGDVGGIGHDGSMVNGVSPNLEGGSTAFPMPGDAALANGGFSGMRTSTATLGAPAAVNAPAAPGGLANGGTGGD